MCQIFRSVSMVMARIVHGAEVFPSQDSKISGADNITGLKQEPIRIPFMNMINTPPEMTTPLRELMALCFVLDELVLYLDTHPLDTEAFALWKELSKLEREGRARYTALCGPLTHADLAYQESFSWLENPWPWDADPAAEG